MLSRQVAGLSIELHPIEQLNFFCQSTLRQVMTYTSRSQISGRLTPYPCGQSTCAGDGAHSSLVMASSLTI
jgi:hypothetical protein